MPNRILKESICTSDNIEMLSAFQETVFYRLIVTVDDFGRYDARPKILASRLFPLKDIRISQIEDALRALTSAELVTLYEVGGKPFLQMNTWEKHQTPRAAKSKYPGPDEGTCKHLQADENICTQMQADAPDIRERYTGNDIRYSEAVAETDARAREAAAPAFDSPDFKADLTSPITYAINELGHLSPLDLQALASFRDDLPDDVIIYGINAACSANVRTWAYARSILNRYVSAGFKSVGDIKAAEAKREAQKAQMVSDGHGGKIANPALNFQQRDNSGYEDAFDNSWMSEFVNLNKGEAANG
jgi:DnaD/phage-associated family protein